MAMLFATSKIIKGISTLNDVLFFMKWHTKNTKQKLVKEIVKKFLALDKELFWNTIDKEK